MAIDLSNAVSLPTYRKLEVLWRNRSLPVRASRTLLEVWSADAPVAMKLADEANALVPMLTSFAPALNRAADLAGEYPGLTDCELLELAGLPIRFPS